MTSHVPRTTKPPQVTSRALDSNSRYWDRYTTAKQPEQDKSPDRKTLNNNRYIEATVGQKRTYSSLLGPTASNSNKRQRAVEQSPRISRYSSTDCKTSERKLPFSGVSSLTSNDQKHIVYIDLDEKPVIAPPRTLQSRQCGPFLIDSSDDSDHSDNDASTTTNTPAQTQLKYRLSSPMPGSSVNKKTSRLIHEQRRAETLRKKNASKEPNQQAVDKKSNTAPQPTVTSSLRKSFSCGSQAIKIDSIVQAPKPSAIYVDKEFVVDLTLDTNSSTDDLSREKGSPTFDRLLSKTNTPSSSDSRAPQWQCPPPIDSTEGHLRRSPEQTLPTPEANIIRFVQNQPSEPPSAQPVISDLERLQEQLSQAFEDTKREERQKQILQEQQAAASRARRQAEKLAENEAADRLRRQQEAQRKEQAQDFQERLKKKRQQAVLEEKLRKETECRRRLEEAERDQELEQQKPKEERQNRQNTQHLLTPISDPAATGEQNERLHPIEVEAEKSTAAINEDSDELIAEEPVVPAYQSLSSKLRANTNAITPKQEDAKPIISSSVVPISLSSREGAVAIQKANHLSHTEKGLREMITREKGQLWLWREMQTMQWPKIRELYQATFHQSISETGLRRRFQKFRRAIDGRNISVDLIKKLADGDESIRRLIIKTCNLPSVSPTNVQATEPYHEEAPKNIPNESLRPISYDSYKPESPTGRATTGGKTIDVNFFFHTLNQVTAEFEALEEEQELPESEPDEADTSFFHYKVWRREFTNREIEDADGDDNVLDEKPWIECGRGSEDRHKMRKIASLEIFQTIPGHPTFASGSFECSHEELPNGLLYLALVNVLVGKVEVAVSRETRYIGERTLGASHAAPSIPRTVYAIKQRTTTVESAHDEVLDETVRTSERTVEACIDGVWTDLDLANEAAIESFTTLTVSPKTPHLGRLWEQVQGKREELRNGLLGNDLFRANAEVRGNVVEVWVEEQKLYGPRNM